MGPVEVIYFTALFLLTLLSLFYYYLAFWALFRKEKNRVYQTDYTPRVTVQIPVYNDRIVERLIEAVLRQDYPDYEVVIADDSTDPVTRAIVDRYGSHQLVRVVRRENREGFKAGALNNAMKYSSGDIIVVFDSDFYPPPNFLREIVKPFRDPRVAYVQARWTFENLPENLITLFAGTSLLIYHHIFYPFKDRQGVIYLSGSAMAIRRRALEEVGGWTAGTLAEDAELTMRFASRGYRSVYLPDLHAPNQLPFLLRVFIRQQARWSSGMIEAFLMNWREVLFSRKIGLREKLILLSIPLMNLAYVLVTVLLFAGLSLWALRIELFDTAVALLMLLLSSGYLAAGYVALKKEGMERLFPRLLLSTYLLGPLLAITNTLSLIRYFLGRRYWHVTLKRWKDG